MKKILIAFVLASLAALGGCLTTQQSANLQAAAILSCSAAQIAAAATVAITSDINSSAGTQADAATAQKVTSDGCASLSKLGTVIAATAQSGQTPAQIAAANPVNTPVVTTSASPKGP